MKFAVLSHNLPPAPGQALVLYKLLSGIDPSQYVLISQADYATVNGKDVVQHYAVSASAKLPAPYYKVSEPPQIRRGSRFGLKYLRKALNFGIAWRHHLKLADEIAAILEKERCGAIIACTANLWNIPAAYRAARKLGIAFFPYYFDWYHYQWIGSLERTIAGWMEPSIVKGATRVIAPNETIRDELAARFKVEPVVIHNPVDLNLYASSEKVEINPDGEIRIVYTGAIYDAQADAFVSLLAAMKRLPHRKLKLAIYTSFSKDSIESLGICGGSSGSNKLDMDRLVEINEYLPFDRIVEVQKQADILFLPLSFKTKYTPELIRTSAPGKLGELLASRRPVLVHAPKGSFPAEYFKRHECGFVVDERDDAALAEMIERIVTDSSSRRRAVTHAWVRACADFDLERERAKFAKLMGVRITRKRRKKQSETDKPSSHPRNHPDNKV
jgi:glycosyltransferase involved in cell wall biosynthesis